MKPMINKQAKNMQSKLYYKKIDTSKVSDAEKKALRREIEFQ